jgi:beta-lactamase regulating signal transducer with metallopeptidase domain
MTWASICGAVMNGLWRASWQSAILIACVLLIRRVLGERLSPRWRCALWMLVALRLILPVLPGSAWSIFNLMPRQPVQAAVVTHLVPVSMPQLIAAPARHAISPIVWLATIWLAGAILLATRLIALNLMFSRRVRRLAVAVPESIMHIWQDCGAEMHTSGLPPVVCTAAVSTPALFGVLRARLLLPADFCQRLTVQEARLVLLHELAHVRGRDLQTNWIIAGLQALHWFNPLVWIGLSCWRSDMEAACDQAVLRVVDNTARTDYGLVLLKLATSLLSPAPSPALGIVTARSQLRRRIAAIVNSDRSWPLCAAMVTVIVALFGLTDARGLRAQTAQAAGTQSTQRVSITAKIITVDSASLANASPMWLETDTTKLMHSAGAEIVDAPNMLVFVKQKAVATVGTTNSYVQDISPATQPSGQTKYVATIGTVTDGIDFSVCPTISADRKYITLDTDIKYTKLLGFNKVPSPKNAAWTIQVPKTQTFESKATVSIPNGESVVMESAGPEDKKSTLVIISATIANGESH